MTLRKIQVEAGDVHSAKAAARYPLEKADSPAAYAAGDGVVIANAMWIGSEDALAKLGLKRGAEVTEEALTSALLGQHARTDAQVRRPGPKPLLDAEGEPLLDADGKKLTKPIVNSFDLTFSAPKSVSMVWALADPELRAEIERAMFVAAASAVEHVIRTRPVIEGERPATGFAASTALHVTARTAADEEVPSPQLHVHTHLVGVQEGTGGLRTPESSALYKHSAMREAGAVGRALVAAELERLGFEIEAGTGRGGKFFEVAGVPSALCKLRSGRSRDVEAWAAEREAGEGGKLNNRERARGGEATRTKKEASSAAEAQAVWCAQGEEFKFSAEAIRGEAAREERSAEERAQLREQLRKTVLRRLWEEGPSVSIGAARALAYEFAPHGLELGEAAAVLREMQTRGELIAIDGWRLTSAEIRERETYVREVVQRAGRDGRPISPRAVKKGVEAAESRFKNGSELADEQREAVRKLSSGAGWAVLTGQAGTGKGPVLEAVAEAHRQDGWQVIATAVDGATTQRLGHQVGAAALTIDQLLFRLRPGQVKLNDQIKLNDQTVILIEEASKVGLRHWTELARLRAQHGVRVIPIGDIQQIGAIESPGMLDVMIADGAVPVATLGKVRRHKNPDDLSQEEHPWINKHLNHMYVGESAEAIKVLREAGAIEMHGDRAEAMEKLVDKWERRRREHVIEARDSILVVHGSNDEVDKVNELAQQRRLDAEELKGEGVRASDRGYELFEGDVVMLREAAYQPQAERAGGPRPARVENGTMGVVSWVDPETESVWVAFEEPGGEQREVRMDMRRLRQRYLAKDDDPEQRPVPALRLSYAGHPFPLQGGTWDYVGVLWGHWSQCKEETYSAAARARFYLDVHTDRESAGWWGTDEERYQRMAKRLKEPRHNLASITYEETPGVTVESRIDEFEQIPELPRSGAPAHDRAPAPDPGEERAPAPEPAEVRAPAPDPLPSVEGLLAPDRAAALRVFAEDLAEEQARLEEEALRAELENARLAFGQLDRAGAREVGLIDHERVGRRGALDELRKLTAQRKAEGKGRRPGGRRARNEAQRVAKRHEDAGQREERALKALDKREQTLRKDGRHPDQWMAQHGEEYARGLGAERELTARMAQRGPAPERGPEPELEPELDAAGPDLGA